MTVFENGIPRRAGPIRTNHDRCYRRQMPNGTKSVKTTNTKAHDQFKNHLE